MIANPLAPANHRNKQAGNPRQVMRHRLWRQRLDILNVKNVCRRSG